MQIQGIVFVGTRTRRPAAMAAFLTDVLGLSPLEGEGTFFGLPDGSSFAVSDVDDDGREERTIGFLVDDLVSAVRELTAAGVEVDEMSSTETQRYVHFRGPDGRLYELIETRALSPRNPAGAAARTPQVSV